MSTYDDLLHVKDIECQNEKRISKEKMLASIICMLKQADEEGLFNIYNFVLHVIK